MIPKYVLLDLFLVCGSWNPKTICDFIYYTQKDNNMFEPSHDPFLYFENKRNKKITNFNV